MPRTGGYVIALGADERTELERRAGTPTLPWREVQRARLVLYAAEGTRDKEIAGRLDCHQRVLVKIEAHEPQLRPAA